MSGENSGWLWILGGLLVLAAMADHPSTPQAQPAETPQPQATAAIQPQTAYYTYTAPVVEQQQEDCWCSGEAETSQQAESDEEQQIDAKKAEIYATLDRAESMLQ